MRGFLQKALVAVFFAALGMNVYLPAQYGNVKPGEAEKQAVAELTRLGVPLQHDPKGVVRWIEAPSSQINDEALRLLPNLPGLEWLEIGGGQVTPASLAELGKCSALKRLYLHDLDLKGDDLGWLSNLTRLEALSLQRTGIDGSVLANIKSPALTVLNLSGNNIIDKDMERIAEMKQLEVLAVASTKITGEGIGKLEGMNSLNELNIMHCNVFDSDVEHFLFMPNLRIVYAAGGIISDMAIHNMIARFPMLAIFR